MNASTASVGKKVIQTTSYVLLPVMSGVLIPDAIAQVIPAGDGTNTAVTVVGEQFDITGGDRSADNTNLFHSFEQFDLSAEQTANFVAETGVQNVLGRISSNHASNIDGTLQVSGSDANLYLINPSGILLGPNAQLNLSGGFTATTATGIEFGTEEFSASTVDYSNFSGDPSSFVFETVQPGAVVNLGELSVENGESINLIGGTVVNAGELSAPGGSITVAAVEGDRSVRISQAEQLLSLEVEVNSTVSTDYGGITTTSIGEMLTGGDLVSATALITNADGSIQLGNTAEQIDETGGSAVASGFISAAGDFGGNINVLGTQVYLNDATLDASGTNGGGFIRVGGDYQGNGPVHNAAQTTVDEFSTLVVSAIEQGDGGRAIAWADDTMQFHGTIFGTGGARAGNGGFAEVSGKEHLSFTGLVDLSAPNGSLGDLLLDPDNIIITNSGSSSTSGGNDYIPSTVLESQISNIELSARNNIVIEDLLDGELTLQAGGSATFTADSNNVSGGEFIMEDLSDVIRGERKEISITGAGITVGRIDTSTSAQNTSGGPAVEVGDVSLISSEGVSVVAIDTHAEISSPPKNSWDGGDVTIRADNGDINVARTISTYSAVGPTPSGRDAGDAGNITLTAADGSIRVGSAYTTEGVLRATSEATKEGSGLGGTIAIHAPNGEVNITGSVVTRSWVGEEEAGNGGSVTISADRRVRILATVDTSSVAEDEEAGNAGLVSIDANVVEVNAIDSRSRDSDGDGETAGSVVLYGEEAVRVGSILATSTGGSDADIFITGNQIDLVGGNNSVEGRTVYLSPFSTERDISLGSDNGSAALNIDTTDINAIANSSNKIVIGPEEQVDQRTLTVDQSVVDSANNRPLIAIRNVGILIGPTPSEPTTETTFLLNGAGEGRIEEAKIQFEGVRNIRGGDGADVFRAESNLLADDFDSVRGRGGFDTLSYEGLDESSVVIDLETLFVEDIQRVVAPDNDGNILIGSNADNIWTVDGNLGDDSGKLNGIVFENFSNLFGGTERDQFNFINGGEITGEVIGNSGFDELNYSNYNSPISIDLEEMTATGVANFSSIESIVGSRAIDTIMGTNADETFTITDTKAGIISGGTLNALQFAEIETIDGGLGSNTFVIDGLTAASGITIAGGSDLPNGQSSNQLVNSGTNTLWQINGRNQGMLAENGVPLISFSEIQNLVNTRTTTTENVAMFNQNDARITGSINSGISDLEIVGNSINIGESDGMGNNQNSTVIGSGQLQIRPADESIGIVVGGIESPNSLLTITTGELAGIQDGFRRITIGRGTHTGGITFGADVAFRDPVRLRSQGDIDTRNGEVRVERGRLLIETEGAIFSDRLVSQTSSVRLIGGEDVSVESVSAGGERGIEIASINGSITTNGTLNTSGDFSSKEVLLTAEQDIRIGDIVTSGSSRGGDVTIFTVEGDITTGGITTANNIEPNGSAQYRAGSVALESPGSIEIEFIDARGNGLNEAPSEVSIAAGETFRATGTIDQPELSNLITGEDRSGGASISTVGAHTGDIRIEYGSENLDAMQFAIGSDGENSSAFRIETPQTAISSGNFINSYTQGNIQLASRGIPVRAAAPSVEHGITASSIKFIEAEMLPESLDLVFTSNEDSESVEDIFTSIETRNGAAFGEYLGVEDKATINVRTAQEALREIEQITNTTPSVLYVYFVPDASSTLAVMDEQQTEESARPDDQLEVMLVTGQGEPIRRRKWGVTRAQVETANRQLRQQATSQFSTARQYLTPAQQLYDWIIRPVTDALAQQQINSLGFVMDGSLRTMPVAVLHSGEAFLVENYSLGVLPSFSLSSIHNTASAERVDYGQERVLAMGASEFDNQPDLPAVSAELKMISEGLGVGDAFLNEAFVLERLQRQLEQEDYGIVHLATHAVFEPGDLQQSYIQLWNEQLSLAQLGDLQLSEEEVRLMILSACSTALGDRASEYGFAGLAVSAGSQAALASIWPVSDEGTLGFMSQFYRELREASVPAEALRETQIQMIKGEVGINDGVVYGPEDEVLADLPELAKSGRWDFSHPFYWSPFTMIGNPW